MGIKVDMIMWKVRETDVSGLTPSSTPILYSWVVDPNWVVTASKKGDEYINTATNHKWYSQAADNSHRVEYNYM